MDIRIPQTDTTSPHCPRASTGRALSRLAELSGTALRLLTIRVITLKRVPETVLAYACCLGIIIDNYS